MDNSIMVYPISTPAESREQVHRLIKNIGTVVQFLNGNRNEHSTYNCEDVVPARQSAETLLQVLCEVHQEMCDMEKTIQEKDEYKTWREEVGYYEKQQARD
jgi:hypothetical protein|tara:strand:- start:513 stop:815 length:303 start_codon:yes stop_codon:yes gene_type:complete